jgi:uncharacterized caspase-like protein
VQGINYLVPVGARLGSESDAKFECVDAGRVLGKMEDAGNELNIVILDACRNNPFTRSFRSVDQGLARMDAPTGSLVAYATAPNSVASDGRGQNGLYTKHLLANIGTPGIPIEEVFKRVRIGVMEETGKKQVPWESSSIAGYYFIAGGTAQMGQQLTARPQVSAEQMRQEQKLKEYIAGLEAEKKQVERERADLQRRRQELDEEAAKKLQEVQAPQENRLREQLAVLESERKKLEQERLALERARKETERLQAIQAAQAAKAPQVVTVAPQVAVAAPPVGQPAPVQPFQTRPRPQTLDRETVLRRLAGIWRIETDGGWRFPLLSLRPGGDTLYGTLQGDSRMLDRVELSGLAVEDGTLHVRLDLMAPREDYVEPRIRWRRVLNGNRGLKPAVRTLECVGDLRSMGEGGVPISCERVDRGAADREFRRVGNGRMVRVD